MHSEVIIDSAITWRVENSCPHRLIKKIAFLQGQYFFELDDKAILPGYPKLIQDVWGIPGPIDAAFTRINCNGKSYIFKVSTL